MVEETVEGQYITANNKKIHYTWVNPELKQEDKPILVFLHDGLGSIGQWKDFPNAVSDKVQLPALVYDRYGHGKSEQLAEKRKPSYLHDEALMFLPDILEALNINNQLILIGHSDGGAIALLYASAYPTRVAGVITEAGHVFVEEAMRVGIRQASSKETSEKLLPLLAKYHGDNTETVFYGWADIWLSDEFSSWNIEDCLPNITAPVLAIQGENDEYGHMEQPKPIVTKVSGPSRELWIEDCKHVPHHEKRDQVLEEVAGFILALSH